MTAEEYKRWVKRLAQYEERRQSLKRPVRNWTEMPTYTGHLDDYVNQMLSAKKYGRSPADKALRLAMMYGVGAVKFNNEGEKQMEKMKKIEKIDWHKPLRLQRYAVKPGGEDPQVKTYKSGRQRVIWVDERVYPVDDQGRAMADVIYSGGYRVRRGAVMVENVPEEEFFVGLYRHHGTSNYFLADAGHMTEEANVRNILYGLPDQWIVDTRKPAEPPKEIVHDPKDWVAVYFNDDNETDTAVSKLMTETEASRRSLHKAIVRVRTTPPPADTARYIQLYRMRENGPWKINAHGLARGGRQEFTWDETKNRGANPRQCAIKVRD
ncbi:MAG: hypothetical protein E6Q76_15760 [Rhizobium sp.]|nr:MAG: hypothetical protein E6Q76_15760 [Rhizobium sp.]